MRIFLDTNVLLDFFRFSKSELEELRKVIGLAKKEKIKILMTSQVQCEFYRNRDGVISDILGQMRKSTQNYQFPAMAKEFDEYEEAVELQKKLPKIYNTLVRSILARAKDEKLAADELISNIFDVATKVNDDEEIFNRAHRRYLLGKPPRKGTDKTFGDAINWEALLSDFESTPTEDLFIISVDGDFVSKYDGAMAHPYLKEEWTSRFPDSEVVVYNSLGAFFKEHFPEIKLASEIGVHEALARLEESGSFATTHEVIEEIVSLGALSLQAAQKFIEIAAGNNQVRWIITDRDIYDLLQDINKDHGAKLKEDAKIYLDTWLAQGADEWE